MWYICIYMQPGVLPYIPVESNVECGISSCRLSSFRLNVVVVFMQFPIGWIAVVECGYHLTVYRPRYVTPRGGTVRLEGKKILVQQKKRIVDVFRSISFSLLDDFALATSWQPSTDKRDNLAKLNIGQNLSERRSAPSRSATRDNKKNTKLPTNSPQTSHSKSFIMFQIAPVRNRVIFHAWLENYEEKIEKIIDMYMSCNFTDLILPYSVCQNVSLSKFFQFW